MKKPEIEDLILKLEVEFDEIEQGTLQPGTSFKDLEDWSSMQALIIIALVDEQYAVSLNGEDLQNCSTIQDIYELILDRQKN